MTAGVGRVTSGVGSDRFPWWKAPTLVCVLAAIIRPSGTRRGGGEVEREVGGVTLEELDSGEQGVDMI